MDPFEDVQNTIRQVLPIVLIGPGVVLVASGLFMWLGGLRWLKAIAAFSAAMAGLVCAWFFTERQFVPMVLFPVILAGVGVYFNKVVVVLLGACMAGLIVLFVPVIAGIEHESKPAKNQTAVEQRLNLLESITWAQEKIEEAKQTIKDTIAEIPKSRENLAIAAAVVICVVGLLSWRLVCAATCSVIGTTLILGGMAVLLLYKGSGPIQQMIAHKHFLALVVLVMLVAGVLIQLVLCPSKQKTINKADMMKEILNEGDKK